MQAKDIQVDYQAGGFNTIPGSTGELSRESSSLNDTIFGQNFVSGQPSLINWSGTANAFYKGLPGYVAKVLKTGTSTGFTAEATTQVGASKTYAIDDPAKSIWDHTVGVTVSDDGGAIDAADIESINYLFGGVTFVSGFTPTGAVTVTGSYLPTESIGKAQTYDLTMNADTEDVTTFALAQANNGHGVFEATQLTVSMSIGGFYNPAQALRDLQLSRDVVVVELNPDGNNKSVARGIFKVDQDSLSGDAGATEAEEVNFSLFVPENVPVPFSWQHEADTTLSQAVQDLLTAWAARDEVTLRYYPEGTANAGFEGSAVITDVSLSGGVDAMNEFSVGLQGTGELADLTP